jgi:hypothetical protein
MSLAAGPVAGVAFVPMRFILDLEALGRESVAQLFRDQIVVGMESGLTRDSPDDSRTGVNIGAFPAFLQDRRKVRTAIDTSRNRNGGRGADLLIFAGIRTHSSRRLLLSA